MKIKQGYKLRSIGETNVVVAVSGGELDLHGLITLNETAASIWRNLENDDLERDEIIKKITDEYDVDADTAAEDTDEFIEKLRGAGLLE